MVIPKNFRFGDPVFQKKPIEYYKPEQGKPKFIQILDLNSMIAASLHYLKGVGSFYCSATQDEDGVVAYGDCCHIMKERGLQDKSSDRFVLPIMIYESKDGKTITKDVSFAMLQLTWVEYKDFYNTVELNGIPFEDIRKFVLRVVGEETGVGQYKRIAPKMVLIQAVRSLLGDAEVKTKAVEFMSKFRELGKDCVAKTITTEQLLKHIESLSLKKAEEKPQQEDKKEERTAPKFKEDVPEENTISNVQVNDISDLSLDEYGLDSIDLSDIVGDIEFPEL